MSDYSANTVILAIAGLNLIFNLYYANFRSPSWWCDPKGLMSLPLFLSTAGLSIYYLTFTEYPNLFGLVEENVQTAAFSLAIASWAFSLGTFVSLGKKFVITNIPQLGFNRRTLKNFSALLVLTIIAVSLISYYGLYQLDFFSLLSLQYGAGQWDSISSNPWLRASVLGTPLMAALIVVWALRGKPLLSPTIIIVCLFSLLPAVFLGGRKDAIFIMIAIAFAASLKRGENRIKPIVYAICIIGVFNYIQAISRDSESLDLSGRIASLTETKKSENTLIGQISIALPILPTVTAAMTVFPSQESHYFGRSYVQTIAGTVLPKVVWGEAAFTSPNQNFHNLYYPDVVDFSMDYSTAAEGYQNFGLPGIPLAYFILGIFLSNLRNIAVAFPKTLWPLINLVVFQAGMWSLRSDSNTFFKMSFYTASVLLILYMISNLRIAHVPTKSKAADPLRPSATP